MSRTRTFWLIGLTIIVVVAVGVALLNRRHLQPRKIAAPIEQSLGLRHIGDIPLPGGANRLDYESIDGTRGQLYIAHLGSDSVVVFDLVQQRVLKEVHDVPGATGMLAVPAKSTVYASAGHANKVVAIDAKTFAVTASISTDAFPDGLAYDSADDKVYVSNESGQSLTVIDARHMRRSAPSQSVATSAIRNSVPSIR